MSTLEKSCQWIRSALDKEYRRAFRPLRHLPRIRYDRVVDAGASRGSFTEAMKKVYGSREVVAIEAIPDLAEALKKRYRDDHGVRIMSAALSDGEGTATFQLNRHDYSSSLLSIDERNSKWFGKDLRIEKTIEVPTITLEGVMSEMGWDQVDLLKMDLQGAEGMVLRGSEHVLDRVQVIFTEILFEPLYEGAWLFWEMREFLADKGFKLCGMSNLVHSAEGDLLQGNATFRRVAAAERGTVGSPV
ncbi:MAG: FkbM family methyltransferase [Candidatus Methylacidiphilales bacterium]